MFAFFFVHHPCFISEVLSGALFFLSQVYPLEIPVMMIHVWQNIWLFVSRYLCFPVILKNNIGKKQLLTMQEILTHNDVFTALFMTDKKEWKPTCPIGGEWFIIQIHPHDILYNQISMFLELIRWYRIILTGNTKWKKQHTKLYIQYGTHTHTHTPWKMLKKI